MHYSIELTLFHLLNKLYNQNMIQMPSILMYYSLRMRYILFILKMFYYYRICLAIQQILPHHMLKKHLIYCYCITTNIELYEDGVQKYCYVYSNDVLFSF